MLLISFLHQWAKALSLHTPTLMRFSGIRSKGKNAAFVFAIANETALRQIHLKGNTRGFCSGTCLPLFLAQRKYEEMASKFGRLHLPNMHQCPGVSSAPALAWLVAHRSYEVALAKLAQPGTHRGAFNRAPAKAQASAVV